MQMLPELHKKYIGQEDNRDFFMMTFDESTNINKVLYLHSGFRRFSTTTMERPIRGQSWPRARTVTRSARATTRW